MGLFVRKTDTGTAHGFYVLHKGTTKLILGLGNSGQQYDMTRHNIGFAVMDAFAERNGASWTTKKALKAEVAEIRIGEQKVILVKPTTMMNLSGEAMSAIQRFYKVTNDHSLVVFDDIDVPFGTIRTRIGGGSGGHNGIKSLIQHANDRFARLRVGVANNHRDKTDAADFVLARFSKDEQARLPNIIDECLVQIQQFIDGEFSAQTVSQNS